MPDFRQSTDFDDAIRAAAGTRLPAVFVEKDYWITQALRVLHEAGEHFVFKGGTSLSKGYGIISRFSEDVDVLLTPRSGESGAQKERRLVAMTEVVADRLNLGWEQVRDPGRGKLPHRADRLLYPRSVDPASSVPEERGVRLDTGFAGGEWPCEIVTITPLVAGAFQNEAEAAEFADLQPFDVRALHPARTLVEKVALLHDVASNFETGSTMADRRCGRHYYDIYQLLGYQDARVALADRDQFARIVTEMDHISRAHYGSSTERPPDGYAASPAFQPERGSELRDWLQARYADVEPLVAQGGFPNFGQVLQRVAQHGNLL
jgi:Nucleotidyl transferase AbiEii toxin, Type IV TA system